MLSLSWWPKEVIDSGVWEQVRESCLELATLSLEAGDGSFKEDEMLKKAENFKISDVIKLTYAIVL